MKQIVNTNLNQQGAQALPAQTPGMAADIQPQDYPKEYEGIPYDKIVKALLEEMGVFGQPAEGNRNTMLYRISRQLRYICDFRAPHLMAIIPDWGLSAAERQESINSAVNSARGTEMPSQLQRVLERLKGAGSESETEEKGEVKEDNPVPANLPRLLRIFVKRNPRNKKAALLSCLPVLSCLLSRLRAEYRDGREESPIFMTVVVGPQASGKSFLKELYNRLAAPMLENDRQQMDAEREYQEKVRRAKNKKDQPERETFVIRCLPANVSNTQLLKRCDQNNGLSVISFAPEIDTVVRSNKGGAWADKGDIYRIGFEGGLFGQDYASETSYSATVELRYNLLLSGTNLAVNNFFKNVENGMMSRFCFAQMADDRGLRIHRVPKFSSTDDEFIKSEVKRLYEMGSNPQPESIVTFSLPRTCAALDDWEDIQIAEYLETGNEALDILRRRAALLGFRAAMVGWALTGGVESKSVVDLAVWTATEVLNQQLALYGQRLNEQAMQSREDMERSRNRLMQSKNTRLFSLLPEKFSKDDLQALRRQHKMTGECAYIISRWAKNGMVEKQIDGRYKKLTDQPVPGEKGGEG
ncbi:MAG: DUF3987 domain-containing protein [Bacteroidaceae bacterium]|nr:DUF3987 domain-containing protein [Bacteroidaceae bacterium]